MYPVYLITKIAETRIVPTSPGAGMTRDGYTLRRGAPTHLMIRLEGEKRWRRLMCWCFSNSGTSFVNILGQPMIVRDYHPGLNR